MSKFWTVVTLLLLIGIALLALEQPSTDTDRISFSDLETECRFDRGETVDIGLNPDNSLSFSGYFPTGSTEADLDYEYKVSNSSVELNIISRDSVTPDDFFDTCLASVVYDARTEPLQSGRYKVTVLHDGEREKEAVIRIK